MRVELRMDRPEKGLQRLPLANVFLQKMEYDAVQLKVRVTTDTWATERVLAEVRGDGTVEFMNTWQPRPTEDECNEVRGFTDSNWNATFPTRSRMTDEEE